jgi:hypothetical protein
MVAITERQATHQTLPLLLNDGVVNKEAPRKSILPRVLEMIRVQGMMGSCRESKGQGEGEAPFRTDQAPR